jgi:signal transduction histidine kinase
MEAVPPAGRICGHPVRSANRRNSPATRIRVCDDMVEETVLDDGPGIPTAERERIFELFTRLAATSRVPGTGIGLYVARRLIQAMGGTISVANRSEGGAAFTVLLPRYVDAVEELWTPSSATERSAESGGIRQG